MSNDFIINESDKGKVNTTDWISFEPRLRRLRKLNYNPSKFGFKQYVVKSKGFLGKVKILFSK